MSRGSLVKNGSVPSFQLLFPLLTHCPGSPTATNDCLNLGAADTLSPTNESKTVKVVNIELLPPRSLRDD